MGKFCQALQKMPVVTKGDAYMENISNDEPLMCCGYSRAVRTRASGIPVAYHEIIQKIARREP